MTAPRNRPFPATFAAFSQFPCPSVRASSAFTPTPVPMASATMSICTGKASVIALSAASPPSRIFPTNALSTMLYTACSAMDRIIGSPIRIISRFTGISFILLFSVIFYEFLLLFAQKERAAPRKPDLRGMLHAQKTKK